MVRNVSLLFFVGFLSANVAAYAAEQRGQPPRPAVQCVIRDLDVKPGTLHKDDRIESFTVDYRCEHGDRRGVDVEIGLQSGAEGWAVIAIQRDVTLKEGNHSIKLKGTGKYHGSAGRFITALKGGGGTELHRLTSNLNCLEWGIQAVTKTENDHCFVRDLSMKPAVLKRGAQIESFKVDYTCKRGQPNSDVEVKIGSGSRYELVAILRDIALLQGNHSVSLSGTGTYKGEGGNFETSLRGNWGRATHLNPIHCTGWGIK